jgi:hypothetical protein
VQSMRLMWKCPSSSSLRVTANSLGVSICALATEAQKHRKVSMGNRSCHSGFGREDESNQKKMNRRIDVGRGLPNPFCASVFLWQAHRFMTESKIHLT